MIHFIFFANALWYYNFNWIKNEWLNDDRKIFNGRIVLEKTYSMKKNWSTQIFMCAYWWKIANICKYKLIKIQMKWKYSTLPMSWNWSAVVCLQCTTMILLNSFVDIFCGLEIVIINDNCTFCVKQRMK